MKKVLLLSGFMIQKQIKTNFFSKPSTYHNMNAESSCQPQDINNIDMNKILKQIATTQYHPEIIIPPKQTKSLFQDGKIFDVAILHTEMPLSQDQSFDSIENCLKTVKTYASEHGYALVSQNMFSTIIYLICDRRQKYDNFHNLTENT